MADSRNWSTKTLAKQLLAYVLAHPELKQDTPILTLLDSLSDAIVAEEVGESLNPWT